MNDNGIQLASTAFPFPSYSPGEIFECRYFGRLIKIITSMPSNKEGLDGGLQMSNEINLLGVTLDSKAQI